MEEKKFCVYKHTTPNGKVYIGITCQEPEQRWKNGKGYDIRSYFRKAIDKYGWDHITHEILASGLYENEASLAEEFYINMFCSTDRDRGYNLKSGGYVGGRYTDAVKEKLSQKNKEYWETHPEKRKEFSDRMMGKKKSVEARKKMSISKTGKPFAHSAEHNRNIGVGIKAFYQTHEEKRKEHGKRIVAYSLAKRQAVVQLTDNGDFVAIYESGKAAMRATGIKDGNINRCCRGKSQHAGGYKWQFAIDYNSGREIAK